ncbi:MAG: DUF4870 domain-containing protein [Opitutales bacterium]|nr:DUF4870 domain-containing protein [Opitutales bacterium]
MSSSFDSPNLEPTRVETDKDAKMFGMLCHLSALAGLIIPFGSIVGPLVFWMLKRDQYEFVNQEGREALNFSISMLIYVVVASLLIFVGIGLILLPILVLFWLIMIIVATIKSSAGESYRYPLNIRLIK